MIRASLDEFKISELLSLGAHDRYWRVRVISETSSTQDELKTELVSNGSCVVTEYQSAGRGRLDRSFQSAPQVALLFSFYVEPTRMAAQGWIPLIAGMATASTLNEMTESRDYVTKWPNDVLTDYGKVAGVLCEKFKDGIIVGIGINVTTEIDDLPVTSATSVLLSSGLEINRNELLPQLLINFLKLYQKWESGADLTPTYRALNSTIGQEVLVSLPGGAELAGRAISVGADGELILESGDIVSVGDITHVRTLS